MIETIQKHQKIRILYIRNINSQQCIKYIKTMHLKFKTQFPSSISYAQSQTQQQILQLDHQYKHQITYDYVIVVGGDGTMIYVANLFKDKTSPPVLGFARGSVPILYNFSIRQGQKIFDQFINQIMLQQIKTDKCSRLHIKKKNLINNTQSIYQNIALSQFIIHREKNNSCVKIDIYIDDNFLTTFFGDGVILATPYGSLAYSLNSNGPIVANNLNSIVLVPICPLSLSFRPICLSNQSKIRLRLDPKSRSTAFISCDGLKTGIQLTHQNQLQIYSSQHYFRIINQVKEGASSTWINKLKAVLKWGSSFTV